jgi:hypothetical protein
VNVIWQLCAAISTRRGCAAARVSILPVRVARFPVSVCGANTVMGAGIAQAMPVKREIGAINKYLKTNTYFIKADAAPATVSERGSAAMDAAMLQRCINKPL